MLNSNISPDLKQNCAKYFSNFKVIKTSTHPQEDTLKSILPINFNLIIPL